MLGLPLILVLMAAWVALDAAELGRQDVKHSTDFKLPLGHDLPIIKGHREQVIKIGPGLEVGLDRSIFRWTLGKTYSDVLYSPQLSLLYGVGNNWDIRITGKIIMARDAKEGLNADTDFYRVGVGARSWFQAAGNWYPFVSMGINYYLFDINTNVKKGSGAEGMPGLSAEAGLAYMVKDWVRVHLAFQGETSILPGSVNYQGNSENVRVHGAGLTLGVSVVF